MNLKCSYLLVRNAASTLFNDDNDDDDDNDGDDATIIFPQQSRVPMQGKNYPLVCSMVSACLLDTYR